ncbi:MAG: hypothetical protein MJ237_03045 [bacterium]|nr:hypothetical protein [bacterium]
MAERENISDKIYNANDSLDINELASLNEDISSDLIDKLQNQVSKDAETLSERSTDDASLFEEPQKTKPQERGTLNINNNIDDNFIKKYKAKLSKAQQKDFEEKKQAEQTAQTASLGATQQEQNVNMPEHNKPKEAETVKMPEHTKPQGTNLPDSVKMPEHSRPQNVEFNAAHGLKDSEQTSENVSIKKLSPTKENRNEQSTNSNIQSNTGEQNNKIEDVTGGNISERPVSQEIIDYKDSLDYLDNNVKYSKYVVYIDPENQEFMDSLTVKERKNLINRIIKEQDSIALTKQRLAKFQMIITHLIVAVITIAIAVPCIYFIINASLETTINNYRNSKSMFQTLYKQKGKIKQDYR